MDKNAVALIVTVYNESETLLTFLQALKSQTYSPKEVIIVDGDSTDNTVEILHKFSKTWKPLKVFVQPGNRSVGRNYAIAHTQCPLIAITDAGCSPHKNWLQEIILPFKNSDVQVVSGYYEGAYENIFEKSLLPFALVMPDKAGKSEFFPSTRSMALRRKVWLASGGFDRRLFHNEDYAYAHKLKWLGYNFTFAPKALVTWFPRKNLKSAAWMFMRFAIGDIQAGIIRPQVKNLFIRFFSFIFFLFLAFQLPILLPVVLIALLVYCLIAIVKNFRYVRDIRAIYLLPLLQLTVDLSVIFGSVVGFLSKIST